MVTTRTTSSHPFPPLRALHSPHSSGLGLGFGLGLGLGSGLGFGPGLGFGLRLGLGLGSHGFHSRGRIPTHHPNPNQVNTSIMGNWFPKKVGLANPNPSPKQEILQGLTLTPHP